MGDLWRAQLAREIRESQRALGGATKKRGKKKPRAKRTPRVPKNFAYNGKERVRYFRLYTLLLEGGKYYVGMTAQTVEARFDQHHRGKGAQWTKIYKPIKILEVRELGLMAESKVVILETALTEEYMNRYGTDHVRGGKWCQITLTMKTINRIEVLPTKPS